MNIWWVIALSGIGTYLMRSTGVWLNPKLVQGRWLNHLPFAVILVISIVSLAGANSNQEIASTIAASLAVVVASWQKLPLVVCVTIGCVVFGALGIAL